MSHGFNDTILAYQLGKPLYSSNAPSIVSDDRPSIASEEKSDVRLHLHGEPPLPPPVVRPKCIPRSALASLYVPVLHELSGHLASAP